METAKIFRLTILVSVVCLAIFLSMSGCGKSVKPKPGRYEWECFVINEPLLSVELSLSFTVTDDGRIIEAIASTFTNRETLTMSPERTAQIVNGRFRLSGFSLPHGFANLVFIGRFITPTRIEGTYRAQEHEGKWSAVHPEEKS